MMYCKIFRFPLSVEAFYLSAFSRNDISYDCLLCVFYNDRNTMMKNSRSQSIKCVTSCNFVIYKMEISDN